MRITPVRQNYLLKLESSHSPKRSWANQEKIGHVVGRSCVHIRKGARWLQRALYSVLLEFPVTFGKAEVNVSIPRYIFQPYQNISTATIYFDLDILLEFVHHDEEI